MNTRKKAVDSLNDFIHAEDQVVLLTGTHQYQKHVIALQCLSRIKESSKILFRANSMSNLVSFFEEHRTNFTTGTAYRLGDHRVYFDTINRTSWKKTPLTFDYGIIYPLDSVCKSNSKERIIEDITNRVKKKLFLISWTDNYDYSWLDYLVSRYIVFDAEEEDKDYHERVLGNV